MVSNKFPSISRLYGWLFSSHRVSVKGWFQPSLVCLHHAAPVQSLCGLGHTEWVWVAWRCSPAVCPSHLPASPCAQSLTWPSMNRWITSPRPWGRRQNCTAKSLGIRLPLSAGSKMMHLWSRSPGGSPFGQPTMALGYELETLTPQTRATSSAWRRTARRWSLPLESCLSSSVSSFLLGMAFGPQPPRGWGGTGCAQQRRSWSSCTHFRSK